MPAEQSKQIFDFQDSTPGRLYSHWQSSGILLFWAGCLITIILIVFTVADYAAGDSVAVMQKINPNTAPAGSLIRLGGIGPARAYDIIQYREKYSESGPVFRHPGDLQVIHGIGPKTVEKIQPWLTFEQIDFYDSKEAVDGRVGN